MIQDLPKELRCYLLRFADRITNICEGDLDYSPNLIGGIL